MRVTLEPAYIRIADSLRARILNGQLKAGERLPSEDELARTHSVGRSTVREALRQLSSQGLLATNRGVAGGTRVTRVDAADVKEMLTLAVTLLSRFESVTVKSLVEAREHLEVPAARLAALHRTTDDLAALAACVETNPPKRGRDTFPKNRAFHKAVLHASGDAMLELLAEPIFTVLRTRFLRDAATPSFWDGVEREHRGVFEAIRRGDAGAAERRMGRHLSALSATYEQIDMRRRHSVKERGRHGHDRVGTRRLSD